MTEEELKEKMKKDLDEVLNVKNIIDFHFDLLQKTYVKGLETGLKVNETKWHKVADGDLPKDHQCVLLSNIYGHTETGYYHNGQWFGREVIFDDVFEWQELPLPSKEMEQAWKEYKPPKESE